MMEYVTLVNRFDEEIGMAEKLRVHKEPQLHRAFSIFLFNSHGEILLQHRSPDKYHSAGLWTNTCCGHPRPGEDTVAAGRRRLKEEMGIEATLVRGPKFIYRASVGRGLEEYELDQILLGYFEGEPRLNYTEATAWAWTSIEALEIAMSAEPGVFTAWLPIALKHAKPFVAQPVPF